MQALQLSRAFPTARVSLRSGLLTWDAETVPHPGAYRYDLRMTYRLGERPRVRVLDPDLKGVAFGKRVPHLFSQIEQTLCLHYHGIRRPGGFGEHCRQQGGESWPERVGFDSSCARIVKGLIERVDEIIPFAGERGWGGEKPGLRRLCIWLVEVEG